MPWETIKLVTSGLTLAAFVAALIAWIIKSKSEERERLIGQAKEDERADLVRDALEFFRIDTGGLTKAQQYQLALEQVRARAQRFKLIAIVVCVIAVLGTVVAGYAVMHSAKVADNPRPERTGQLRDEPKSIALLASIWKVSLDTKGELVGTMEFSERANGVSPATLEKLGKWVSNQLGIDLPTNAPKVRLKVMIPADLDNQKPIIERFPDGKMEILFWDLRGTGKSRTPLTWEALKEMREPFQLEIRVPGREAVVIQATNGTAFIKEMDLAPATVNIGVEKFTGPDDGISQRVCSQLSANSLIRIVSPEMLEAVRKEIEADKEQLRRYPMAQMRIRSLGVEYLISGSITAKTP
jgi:hypothetical protein